MGKIVFVSYLFAPMARAAGVNRAYFVKYLAEAGWDVDVVTGEHYRSLMLVIQKDPSLLEVLPPGVRIHRYDSLKGWLAYDLAALTSRLLGRSYPVRKAWLRDAERHFSPPDGAVVLAILSTPENAILAYRLAEKFDLHLALHFVDNMRGVDPKIIKRAAVVTAVTEYIRDQLREAYGHPHIEVINNGYPSELEVPTQSELSRPLKMIYTGSFTVAGRPERFLRAFKELRHRKPQLGERIELDLYGQKAGYYYNLFLRKFEAPGIRFRGYLGIGSLNRALSQADIGMVCLARDVSFSSKAYSYLNAGLPIFAATTHPGLRDFVREHGVGIACDNEQGAIREALEGLARNPEAVLRWRENVLRIRSEFSLRRQVQKLSALLENLET